MPDQLLRRLDRQGHAVDSESFGLHRVLAGHVAEAMVADVVEQGEQRHDADQRAGLKQDLPTLKVLDKLRLEIWLSML